MEETRRRGEEKGSVGGESIAEASTSHVASARDEYPDGHWRKTRKETNSNPVGRQEERGNKVNQQPRRKTGSRKKIVYLSQPASRDSTQTCCVTDFVSALSLPGSLSDKLAEVRKQIEASADLYGYCTTKSQVNRILFRLWSAECVKLDALNTPPKADEAFYHAIGVTRDYFHFIRDFSLATETCSLLCTEVTCIEHFKQAMACLYLSDLAVFVDTSSEIILHCSLQTLIALLELLRDISANAESANDGAIFHNILSSLNCVASSFAYKYDKECGVLPAEYRKALLLVEEVFSRFKQDSCEKGYTAVAAAESIDPCAHKSSLEVQLASTFSYDFPPPTYATRLMLDAGNRKDFPSKLREWSPFLKAKAKLGQTTFMVYVHALKRFQQFLLDTVASASHRGSEAVMESSHTLQEVQEVLNVAFMNIADENDAVLFAESLLWSKTFDPLRNVLRSLPCESFVQQSMLYLSNKMVQTTSSGCVLRSMLACVAMHPETVVKRLIFDCVRHQSQVNQIILYLRRLKNVLYLHTDEESRSPSLGLRVLLEAVEYCVIEKGGRTEEENVLQLLRGFTTLGDPLDDCKHPVFSSSEILHHFLLLHFDLLQSGATLRSAAFFKVLQVLVEKSVQRASFPTEDFGRLLCIIMHHVDGRTFTSRDSEQSGPFLDAIEAIDELSLVCQKYLHELMKDHDKKASLLAFLSEEIPSKCGWKGKLSLLKLLSQQSLSSTIIDEAIVNDVANEIKCADDFPSAVAIMFTLACISGQDKSILGFWADTFHEGRKAGHHNPILVIWSTMINSFCSQVSSLSLSEVKRTLRRVISEFVPWCTKDEALHIGCTLYPFIMLLTLHKRTGFGEQAFFDSCLAQVAGGCQAIQHKIQSGPQGSVCSTLVAAILKIDLLETLVAALLTVVHQQGEIQGEAMAQSAAQRIHQLCLYICILAMESVKSDSKTLVLVLGWHCARALCTSIRALEATTVDNSLVNALIEVLSILFEEDHAQRYIDDNSSSSCWRYTHQLVEQLFGGDPRVEWPFHQPQNKEVDGQELSETIKASVQASVSAQVASLKRSIYLEVKPILEIFLESVGKDGCDHGLQPCEGEGLQSPNQAAPLSATVVQHKYGRDFLKSFMTGCTQVPPDLDIDAFATLLNRQ